MGNYQSRREEDSFQERSHTLPKKSSGLRARLSSLKTGSLKRPNAIYGNQGQRNNMLLGGKKWHSDCSLNDIKGRRHGPVVEDDLQLVPSRGEEIPEEEKGTCIVNLIKTEGSVMGLTLSGGADKEGRPRVSNLRSTGIAAKSDQLQVGDFIISVNGIRTSKLKHAEIISLLKNVGEKVSLEIEYHLPPTTVETPSIIQKTTDISLKKEDGSYGFVLRGGGHEQHCKSRPLVVTHIRPDSPAHREGSLKTGDRILAIGGTPLRSVCLEEATSIMQHYDDQVMFTVEYDVSVMDAVANASGPLLVEVSKTPGVELGITLAKSTHRKKSVLCIDRVKPASIADRCGALHIGDQILSIDNVSMENGGVSVRESSEMLNSASDQVKLEILPVSHLAITSSKQLGHNRFTPVISSAQSMSALNPQRAGSARYQAGSTLTGYGRGSNRWPRKRVPRPKHSASATYSTDYEGSGLVSDIFSALKIEKCMSLVSTDYFGGNQVVHPEVLEIRLLTADDGCDLVTCNSSPPDFGIQLRGGVFTTEILSSSPLIGYIEPDRAADRCGVLQAGDRLLTVNGYSCDECSMDEVNQMISDAYYTGQALLEVEFDVAESVVPSSGTFNAKLPKRRGVDLGIVVGVCNNQPGSPLMIAEVKRGSVAHRTGTLEAGDRLLAIDGVRLDECSADDAHALLASAEDLVTLKIQKDEENSDDVEASNTISYTVELKRHGGPLGITISGTEEPFDPIIISGLTPGGLAARTGAIQEGDKIQSINNISLRAKPLSEAIVLLQKAGELVTLKIKRHLSVVEKPKPTQNLPDVPSSSFTPPTSVSNNPLLNEAMSEFSDPEDDILPPRMGPLSDHSPYSDTASSSKISTPTVTTAILKDHGFRPGPAGAPSVDSAVESWEGSSADMQKTKSSTDFDEFDRQNTISPLASFFHTLPMSKVPKKIVQFLEQGSQPQDFSSLQSHSRPYSHNFSTPQWRTQPQSSHSRTDATISNVDKLRTKLEAGSSRTYSDTWGTREQIRARNFKSPERRSANDFDNNRSRAAPVADWQRALEDLQSVGQSSNYLKDLESKFTFDTEDRNSYSSYRRPPPRDDLFRSKQPPGDAYDSGYRGSRKDYGLKMKTVPSVSQQLYKVALFKDSLNEDFGFSMSDGQLEGGVYVHNIRLGGPAAKAGLQPFDRVLQINGTSTHDVDSSMAVALVSLSQTRLDILISRYPSNSSSLPTHPQSSLFPSNYHSGGRLPTDPSYPAPI